jgi:hypothetical protein
MAKKVIKTIRANRIQLEDLKGNPRIILDASKEKVAYIHILDANRCTSVALSVHLDTNESSIELHNKVSLNGAGEEGGALTIRDGKGHLKITMFCHPETNEPKINLYNEPKSSRSKGKKSR